MTKTRSIIALYPGISNSIHPRSGCLALQDIHATQYLETCLPWVVNQNHCDPVVGKEIARADELLISPEIGESKGVIVDHLQKALRPAAMLNIWPSGRPDRCPVETVTLGKEFNFESCEVIMQMLRTSSSAHTAAGSRNAPAVSSLQA